MSNVGTSSANHRTSSLARIRHERGLTQEQLAARAGLSVRTINRIEQGTTKPYRTTIGAIAAALACAPAELVARPHSSYEISCHDVADVVAAVRETVQAELTNTDNVDVVIAEGVALVVAMADSWPTSGPSFAAFLDAYLPGRIKELSDR